MIADEGVGMTLRVQGRVQGVWYRASAVDAARRIGVTGTVRNMPDGTVEVVAEGARARCEALIAWCHEGPPLARVDRIDVQWCPATGRHTAFEARYR